jgi:hypothetical protein
MHAKRISLVAILSSPEGCGVTIIAAGACSGVLRFSQARFGDWDISPIERRQ